MPAEFRVVSLRWADAAGRRSATSCCRRPCPGIITGVILGLLRAAGETAPILFTVAAFYLPRLPHLAPDQTMALPYHLYVISTQVPGMPLPSSTARRWCCWRWCCLLNLVAVLRALAFRRKRQW